MQRKYPGQSGLNKKLMKLKLQGYSVQEPPSKAYICICKFVLFFLKSPFPQFVCLWPHKTWICPWLWGFQGWRGSELWLGINALKGIFEGWPTTCLSWHVWLWILFPALQKCRLNRRKLNPAMTLLRSPFSFSTHMENSHHLAGVGSTLCPVISNVLWTVAQKVEERILE